ncbi:MAG: hypothetical protein JWR37_4253 [Mycobacterium sp.]|nr:hypothetical protein [Mycobacterium sp.]
MAELTAALTADFDLPVLLEAVAVDARVCLDAYSAAVVLLDPRRAAEDAVVEIVAESVREDSARDLDFQRTGPALVSARDGALTLIDDLADAHDTRWPRYRQDATAAGMRGVRAFPITAVGVPLGAVVVHTDKPWGQSRPNDIGQTLANLTAIALSAGPAEDRRAGTADAMNTALQGTLLITTAIGVIAEHLRLDAGAARLTLRRLARAHRVTVTAHARAVIDAHNADPQASGATGVFGPPPDA